MPPSVIESALLAVLDKRNHPMLIHCNKGKVSSPSWKQGIGFSGFATFLMLTELTNDASHSIGLVASLVVSVASKAGQRMSVSQSKHFESSLCSPSRINDPDFALITESTLNSLRYCKYSHPKERTGDQNFVATFDLSAVQSRLGTEECKRWLPTWMEKKVATSSSAVVQRDDHGNGVQVDVETKVEEQQQAVEVPP
jgi:hypothetical protein